VYLTELSDYSLVSPFGKGNGLNQCYFSLSTGDICSIQSDSSDDTHLFLRALATLAPPTEGVYNFKGKPLNFSDHTKLLPVKKKIGYIAHDSAMINNRTIRENMLLKRYYFDNSLERELDEDTDLLFRLFKIDNILDTRTTEVDLLKLRLAITIRELMKRPELLLLERPEDFVGHTHFDIFVNILKKMILPKVTIVFLSYNADFILELANRNIQINNGKITDI